MKHNHHIHSLAVAVPLAVVLFFSCVRESPTVNPADITTGGGSVTTGYYYPEVVNVYPANGTNGNPTNTKYVIVSNIPINTTTLSSNISISSSSLGGLTEGVHYIIGTGPAPVTIVTIEFTGVMNPIPDNDTISVSIGSGIRDIAQNVTLNNPGVRTFSVGTTADTTAPATVGGSNTPTGGGISRTAPGISIQFSETIDVSTLNASTFYLETGGTNKVPATISYVHPTATLTPTETLAKNTLYTVHVTTGVKDLSGNALPAEVTWNFTTVNTEIDPVPGAPTITSALSVDAVTTTTAQLSWATSEATNYTLIWGRKNDASGNTEQDLLAFTSLHTIILTPLTAKKRYYAQLSAYNDIAGNSGVASSVLEFNALTGEMPSTLAGGANNQHSAKAIPNKWDAGVFVFWTDESSGNKYLYAQRFDNTPATKWGAGGKTLANNAGTNYYYLGATEDEVGGFIVLYSIGGNGIYAKRFDSDGTIVNWGTNSDDTTKTGITIDAAGTNPSAVPVYVNTVTEIASGQTEMASEELPNYFYDDDNALTGFTDAVDIVVNTTDHTGTTIKNLLQDFDYIVGQSALRVTAGKNYAIGSGTSIQNDTAWSYTTYKSTNYTSGGTFVYSSQSFPAPGNPPWTTWLGIGDIISDGTGFGLITSTSTITISPGTVTSGTATSSPGNHLVKAGRTWKTSPAVTTDDIAFNQTDDIYQRITLVEDEDLTLAGNASFNAGDTFYIYQKTQVGADETHEGFHLVDATASFVTTDGVQTGDIVYNITDNVYTTVSATSNTVLALSSDGQFNNGDEYFIVANTITSGTSEASGSNDTLLDTSKDFVTLGVQTGDLVRNNTDNLSSTVKTVNVTSLVLDSAVGFDNAGDGYTVYKQRSYGTATNNSNHLYDSQWNFSGVNVGDIVYNETDDLFRRVTAVSNNDLTLSGDIQLASGKTYRIFSLTQIDTGTADGTANNYLFDTSANFVGSGVSPGHLAYNSTDTTYAVVDAVEATALTLKSAASFDTGDSYIIYDDYFQSPAHPLNQFYRFTIDFAIGITGTTPYTIYNTLLTGTADSLPANPLYDSLADFTSSGVVAGDIVISFEDVFNKNITSVAAGGVKKHSLDLSDDIFDVGTADNNEDYEIIRFALANTNATHVIQAGVADGGGAGSLVDNAPNDFTAKVQVGDVVYNFTTNAYAMVRAVAATTLTLSHNSISFANGDYYLIYRHRGVLYVWQNGTNIQGKILNIEGGAAPVTLKAEWTIATGTNPTAIPDGMGSALVIYNNTATPSQVVIRKLDGTGTSLWGPVEIDTQIASAETIQIVQSDNAGGLVVLYSIAGALRVQRIDTSGARQWGANGQAIGNPTAPSQVDMAYAGGNDVIVVANIGGNIWCCRVGTTNWAGYYISSATGTQQNPKIFLNGADTIISWEDDRFASFSGRGIFGMKINAATGARDITWYADTSSTDLNGVAFVLNDFNEYWGNILLVPYNNGAGALLFWEDYRTAGEGINLLYDDVTTFGP